MDTIDEFARFLYTLTKYNDAERNQLIGDKLSSIEEKILELQRQKRILLAFSNSFARHHDDIDT